MGDGRAASGLTAGCSVAVRGDLCGETRTSNASALRAEEGSRATSRTRTRGWPMRREARKQATHVPRADDARRTWPSHGRQSRAPWTRPGDPQQRRQSLRRAPWPAEAQSSARVLRGYEGRMPSGVNTHHLVVLGRAGALFVVHVGFLGLMRATEDRKVSDVSWARGTRESDAPRTQQRQR